MVNELNIDNIYKPDKPFTSEVAKQIVEHFGLEELDRILMERLRTDTKRIDAIPDISFNKEVDIEYLT